VPLETEEVEVGAPVVDRAAKGITTMLPSEDAIWVAEELGRRFGLPSWQFAMTATDANRFVLRFARHLTGRPRIAVFDWCYHGTVDETLAVLDGDRVVPRPGAMGAPADVGGTTAVVPFNDADALDRRLAVGDVACLLMEPALTNIATSKLASLTGATMLPYFFRRLPGAEGYRVDIGPPLPGFPSDDAIADARTFFARLEDYIRLAPEQYLWMYKKFKGRPAPYPDIYAAANPRAP
jgi:hypothetical protein